MSATVRAFTYALYVLLRNNDGEVKVPQHVLEAIARDFLPDIIATCTASSKEDRHTENAAQHSASQPYEDQPKR